MKAVPVPNDAQTLHETKRGLAVVLEAQDRRTSGENKNTPPEKIS